MYRNHLESPISIDNKRSFIILTQLSIILLSRVHIHNNINCNQLKSAALINKKLSRLHLILSLQFSPIFLLKWPAQRSSRRCWTPRRRSGTQIAPSYRSTWQSVAGSSSSIPGVTPPGSGSDPPIRPRSTNSIDCPTIDSCDCCCCGYYYSAPCWSHFHYHGHRHSPQSRSQAHSSRGIPEKKNHKKLTSNKQIINLKLTKPTWTVK